MSLTTKERDMMLHALGLNASKRSYRNHFCCSSENVAVWESLAKRGLAQDVRGEAIGAGRTFRVTDAGREALGVRSETEEARLAKRRLQRLRKRMSQS